MGNKAWRKENTSNSLSEVFASIKVPHGTNFWRNLFAFTGPGLMIAVGYMDPATGLQILQAVPNMATRFCPSSLFLTYLL